ncbi:MAG: homoserine O-succinyltransferase [Acidimicrobiales bacterium]
MVIASAGDSTRADAIEHGPKARGRSGDATSVEVAFVNNMPSSAFDATEQQFVGLLEGAARELGDLTVRFSRFALSGLERSAEVEERLERDYRPIELIYSERPDGLIVTGTEPLADDLKSETYWGALAELIAWAEVATASALLSCLAAHAAALLFDGIERETLEKKCSGVFVQEVRTNHPLTEGLGPVVHMPHSRLNDLPSALLQEGGYTSLIESPEMNWTVAVKDRGRCTFVLVQGHPEYSTTSLLREYRRDMQRFLRAERPVAPVIPVGYLDDESHRLLERFEARALAYPLAPELMNEFPFEQVAERLVNTWQSSGTRLFANWLRIIQCRRQQSAR